MALSKMLVIFIVLFVALGFLVYASLNLNEEVVVSSSGTEVASLSSTVTVNVLNGTASANYSTYANSSAYWDNLNSPSDISPSDIGASGVGDCGVDGLVQNTTSGGVECVDNSVFQSRVSGTCSSGSSIRIIDQDGTVTCETDSGGDIDTIVAGTGLTGGGSTGTVTLNLNQTVPTYYSILEGDSLDLRTQLENAGHSDTFFIPSGNYYIDEPLIIQKRAITLIGENARDTRIRAYANFTGEAMIWLNNTVSTNGDDFTIKDLTLAGDDNLNNLLNIHGGANPFVMSVNFEGFNGTAISTEEPVDNSSASYYGEYYDLKFYNSGVKNGTVCIHFFKANENLVVGGLFGSCEVGILINDSDHIKVYGTSFELANDDQYGSSRAISITGTNGTGTGSRRIFISSPRMESWETGVYIDEMVGDVRIDAPHFAHINDHSDPDGGEVVIEPNYGSTWPQGKLTRIESFMTMSDDLNVSDGEINVINGLESLTLYDNGFEGVLETSRSNMVIGNDGGNGDIFFRNTGGSATLRVYESAGTLYGLMYHNGSKFIIGNSDSQSVHINNLSTTDITSLNLKFTVDGISSSTDADHVDTESSWGICPNMTTAGGVLEGCIVYTSDDDIIYVGASNGANAITYRDWIGTTLDNVSFETDVYITSGSLDVAGEGGVGSETCVSVLNPDDGSGHEGGLMEMCSSGWGESSLTFGANMIQPGAGFWKFKDDSSNGFLIEQHDSPYEDRFLVDSDGVVVYEDMTIESLTGAGNDYLCINENGTLYRDNVGCT